MAVNKPSSDLELIQRVASYDSKALEALYNRYSPLLFTIIKKIVADAELAEDILSDVFVIIWRKINQFDLSAGNVYTWFITLARNKAIDEIRRRENPGKTEEYSDDYENEFIIPKLSKSIEPIDLKTALNIKHGVESALNKLTEAQKYVIYLAFYEGLTQNEIASKLNIPLPTVKAKIQNALINLKDNLIKGEA